MPTTVEAPSATHLQVTGKAPEGHHVLAVLAKRTYLLKPGRPPALAPEQLPLVGEPAVADDPSLRLLADVDLYPWKPATDVVLLGTAHGRGRTTFDVTVAVGGKTAKKIRVFGDREVAAVGSGEAMVLPPAPVDTVPLAYTHAYGGTDTAALARHGNPWAAIGDYLDPAVHTGEAWNPFRYPRNPAGRGYLIEPTVEAINTLVMPNLEDPLAPLTAERLYARKHGWWYKQPLPQATEWLAYSWFPRVGCFGKFPTLGEPKAVAEIERGYVPADFLADRERTTADHFRLTQGASPGLQVPHLRGGEVVTADNVTADGRRFEFAVPARPRIWVDGRKGTLKETEPVVHTVLLEPDAGRATVVWRGAAPALRGYLQEELVKMPFKVVWE